MARSLIIIAVLAGLLSLPQLDKLVGEIPDPGCLTTIPVMKENGSDIHIWYGSQQLFGQLGKPQRWANILGRVHNPGEIASLTYSLNSGEEHTINLGPDERRLACKGDFNIEISIDWLKPGKNQVDVIASYRNGNKFVEAIQIDFTNGISWALPYSINWDSISQLSDAVQVVDGLWQFNENGLQPSTISYDRVVALGDQTWQDIEILVPFIVYSIDPMDSSSNGAGFGIIMRWNGHSDEPVKCEQPRCGWWDSGAAVWYKWDLYGKDERLLLRGYQDTTLDVAEEIDLLLGEWYYLRMAVETTSENSQIYQLKLWKADHSEPEEWTLKGIQGDSGPRSGSVLLVAHHADIVFGDLEVAPLP
ncbi:MAG: hypothetical protein HN413_10125 [Chloroflexi bacterium]|nr:hypothetical protein [Chloroflexota bacterium]